jgi:DNA-binding GntR family transcriptional regulator
MEKSFSIADIVFEKIEDAILSGEFARGDVITELKLCGMLNVSRTPVREALTRLRQEGLVKESGKGAVVVGVNEDDLYDIYEVRMRIEGLAAAKCAEVITEEQLRALGETLELQEFYTAKNQPESIKKLDSEFHERIYSYCGSKTLEVLLCELHRKVKRYRKYMFMIFIV